MRVNTDHIVVRSWGSSAGGECLHCGQILKFELPIDLGVMNAAAAKFVKRHVRCKPAEPGKKSQRFVALEPQVMPVGRQSFVVIQTHPTRGKEYYNAKRSSWLPTSSMRPPEKGVPRPSFFRRRENADAIATKLNLHPA
jgi:hypothetical protein